MKPRVVVVGGGVAGLAAAMALAADGARVRLFERAPTLGGKAGELWLDAFRFDTGPTVLTLPDVLRSTLDLLPAISDGDIPALEPVDPSSRVVLPSGRRWDVWRDPDRAAGGLPHGLRAPFRALLDEARRLYEAAAPTFVFGPPPGPGRLAAFALRHGASSHPHRRLPGLLAALGADADLRAFFLRFATYVGANPLRAPAVLHNVAWVELGLGGVTVRGGTHALVRAMAQRARAAGVSVCCATPVLALVRRGRRVVAVRTTDGEEPVDGVVSAADLSASLRLAGAEARPLRRPASLSGTVLLLALRGRVEGPAHEVLFPATYGPEFAAIELGAMPAGPTLYLHASARAAPGDAPPGSENLFVMANAPALPAGHDAFPRGAWPAPAGLSARERDRLPPLHDPDGALVRGPEARYAEHLLSVLEERGVGVLERLVGWRMLGPRYLARFGERGAIYGDAPDGLLGALRPRPFVPGVPNVVLAGGTVHPGGGVPLAMLSGRRAARLLRERLG